jgi:hypothetical protein
MFNFPMQLVLSAMFGATAAYIVTQNTRTILAAGIVSLGAIAIINRIALEFMPDKNGMPIPGTINLIFAAFVGIAIGLAFRRFDFRNNDAN